MRGRARLRQRPRARQHETGGGWPTTGGWLIGAAFPLSGSLAIRRDDFLARGGSASASGRAGNRATAALITMADHAALAVAAAGRIERR